MAEPSVKGSMLVLSIITMRRLKQAAEIAPEDLEKTFSPDAVALLKRSGRIPLDVFEKALSPETIELLDEKIVITSWYPMWQFNEIQEFLWEHLNKRNPEEARRAGAESFKAMMKSGRYPQFEYAGRAEGPSSKKDVIRQARLISSILTGYYNFLDVEVTLDPDSEDLQMYYRNASHFCEPLRYTTEGFMTAVSRVRNGTTDWISERLSPDVILFTLPHAKWAK
jgi:hypothetical protein